MKLALAARGSQEAGFTQSRAEKFALLSNVKSTALTVHHFCPVSTVCCDVSEGGRCFAVNTAAAAPSA